MRNNKMANEQYLRFSKMIDNERAKFVKKALNYLDGDQENEMIKVLNSAGIGRTNWQTRGIIPRYRNITKMIIEKSAMLFNDCEPKVEVYTNDIDDIDDIEGTSEYLSILDAAGWIDTFINLDQVVRLTKTACLLCNYDAETDNICFDILHRGNSEVMINSNNKEIVAVVYITGEYENVRSFRVITPELFVDFEVGQTGVADNVVTVPNPYGIVPIVPFYDTQKPRMGFWVEAPKDLISINEMYNIHLTDSEFSAKWEKYPTLFTNQTPAGQQRNVETFTDSNAGPSVRTMLGYGNGGTGQMPGNIGGPDRMIQMDSQGVDNPFIEYKAPGVDLAGLDTVFNQWVRDFAYDWSVRVKTEGTGSATSGFQLVVEEIDNLELRKQRQRMFEAGFKKMYQVIKTLWNHTHGQVFGVDTVSEVEFADPKLPVDEKATEDVWTIRITEGRASKVDYFMEAKGYSRQEAEAKVAEIEEYALAPVPLQPTVIVPASDEQTQADKVEDYTEEDNTAM